jgi:hypothetical protein
VRSNIIFVVGENRRMGLIDGCARQSSGTGGNGARAYGDPTCLRGGGVSGGDRQCDGDSIWEGYSEGTRGVALLVSL